MELVRNLGKTGGSSEGCAREDHQLQSRTGAYNESASRRLVWRTNADPGGTQEAA
jgi:hypothetical protein